MAKINADDILWALNGGMNAGTEFIFSFVCDLSSFALHSCLSDH